MRSMVEGFRNPTPGDQRGRSPFATEGVMGFQGELGDQLGSPGPLGPRRAGEPPSAGLRKEGLNHQNSRDQ